MAAGVMLAGTQATQAAIVKFDAGAASQQITLALHQAGLTDLRAAAQADKITVHGMVASAGDNDKARQIFDQLARGKVVRKYDIADVDADNLRQSLGDFATQVDYMGHGVFKVSGKVQSLQHFREVLATVKSDLGANIKRIDVDVKEVRTPIANVDYSEVVETNGVHYVQTTDGTKHFFYTAESGNGSKKDHVTD
jgi:type III secretion protein D